MSKVPEAADAPAKLCECGCGEPAPTAKKHDPYRGHVKGQPMRYVRGHSGRMRRVVLEPGERFGRLTFVADAERRVTASGKPFARARVVCDCGTELEVDVGNLRSGRTRSCGCSRRGAEA